MKKIRGYVSSRQFMGESCHQSTQNLVIRDYCERSSLVYLLSGVEYSINNSFLMLNELASQIPDLIDGVVAYSLFQLPENPEERGDIYEKFLENNGEIHFALEGLKITNYSELLRVEQIWLVRQTMQNCITTIYDD
jgi:sporadic carbohydrate cluster protein (TIGR04323 family)